MSLKNAACSLKNGRVKQRNEEKSAKMAESTK